MPSFAGEILHRILTRQTQQLQEAGDKYCHLNSDSCGDAEYRAVPPFGDCQMLDLR